MVQCTSLLPQLGCEHTNTHPYSAVTASPLSTTTLSSIRQSLTRSWATKWSQRAVVVSRHLSPHLVLCNQLTHDQGAGNIGEDPNTYTDGDIVREGFVGESERPEYSAGRGGAGNMVGTPRSGSPRIGSPRISSPRSGTPVSASEEVIPETAMRPADGHENFHTGRGGQGNVHKDKYGGHSAPQDGSKPSLLEKAKHAVGLDKHKHEESPLKQETQL